MIASTLKFSAPAFAQPPISITACGKITKPGFYELDSDLNASSPSAGDCIVITAAGVTINLNRHVLQGAGAGDGIHVKALASKAFIEGEGAIIEGFGEGIEIDAPNAFAENFTVRSNGDAGVLLFQTHGAFVANINADGNKNDGVTVSRGSANVLQDVEASSNGRYGIWLLSSSHDAVGGFLVNDNSISGIYLGCSSVGPGGLCARLAPPSNFNIIFGGTASTNSNWPLQNYGVVVDHGDNNNRIVGVSTSNDIVVDLYDGNPDCGSNYWAADAFDTTDPPSPGSCVR